MDGDPMRLVDRMKRALRGHACRYEALPTIQVYTCPLPGDDDLEFERDMAYMRDLLASIEVELIGTGRRVVGPDHGQWLDSWWALDGLRDDDSWQIEVPA